MRVKIERTGGFAGERTTVALYETDDLPEAEAARVREAVDALASARARGEELGEIGADLPTYRITVGDAQVFEVGGDPSADLGTPLAALLRGPADPP